VAGQAIDPGHKNASPITQMVWGSGLPLLILAIPSLSIMVLFRRKIGYRTLQPWMLFIIFFVLFALGGGPALSGTLTEDASPARYLTVLAACVVTGLGMFWRWRAWQDIKRGVRWHTKSRGISHLHSVLPMLTEYVVQRYVEPFICMVAGIIFLHVSTPFGFWLFFSGASLAAMESMIHDIQINNALDQLDGIVEGEIAEENHAYFTQNQANINSPSIEAMSGIAVGFSPELQQQVARRRAAAEARQMATTDASAAAKAQDQTVLDTVIVDQSQDPE